MVAERTGPLSAVKLSGSIPPLAESFHQRPETGLDLRAGLYPGDTVVLTHRGRPGERREHMSSVQVDGVSPAVLAAGGAYQGTHARQSVLWKPEAHPVPFRRGLSLEADGLAEAAITHWQDMLVTSTRLLGNGHANAVTARDRLAAAYESAGRFGEAIAVFSTALADRERNQGPEHPDTLTARGNLAHAYSSAGRPAEAVALYEQVTASAAGTSAPGIRSRWPRGPSWRAHTRRPPGARRRLPRTRCCWPTPNDCWARGTRTRWPHGRTWTRPPVAERKPEAGPPWGLGLGLGLGFGASRGARARVSGGPRGGAPRVSGKT